MEPSNDTDILQGNGYYGNQNGNDYSNSAYPEPINNYTVPNNGYPNSNSYMNPNLEVKYQFGKKVEAEPEPEPDYFTDMQPEFKRTQKVINDLNIGSVCAI